MFLYRRVSLGMLLLTAALFVGCATETATSPSAEEPASTTQLVSTPVNSVCPIMGGEVAEEGGRVEWNGQTVGFCCPQCIPGWNDLSDEDKGARLAEASSSTHTDHDGMHGDG